jgi:hypothetical protein
VERRAANAFTLNLVPRLSRVKAAKPFKDDKMQPHASWNAAFTQGEKKAHTRENVYFQNAWRLLSR